MPTTDLFDRYLHAVKFWLPKAQQQDILAELAEDLHSQVEEREAALGHPLDESGLGAILKQRGAPMRVAAGFIPEQRLISPAMVPIYRLVLKIVLFWVLAPLFVIVFLGPIFTSGHPERALLQFFVEAWRGGFMTVGIVTAVFALLDRYHGKIKWFDDWDPRKLPRVPVVHQTTQRSNDLAGFVFGIAAFVFWASMMWHRTEVGFPYGPHLILGPIWKLLYWPVLGFTLARAFVDLSSFLRPVWMRVHSWLRLSLDAATILIAVALLKVDNWIELAGPYLSRADVAKAMPWVKGTVEITLISIAVITLGDAVSQLRLLFGAKPGAPVPILTVS